MLVDEAAKNFKKTDEFKDVKEEVLRAKKNMILMTKKGSQHRTKLEKLKSKLLNQIRESRKKVDKILDDLENATVTELEKECSRETLETRNDFKIYDDIISGLNGVTELFAGKKDSSESEKQAFVGVKQAKKLIKDSDRVSAFVKHSFNYEPIKFSPDTRINVWLKSIALLGSFSFRTKMYSAELLDKYNVRIPEDKKDCDIFGCKFLEDGKVIITDWDNKNVKILSSDYKISDFIALEGPPNDICILNHQTVLVTLPQQKLVQFIDISPKMILTRRIATDDTCRGLACHGGMIYVVCGGFKGESDGKVCVYSVTGDLVRVIEKNNNGQRIFYSPIAIAVVSDGKMLHITDGQRGIITMTTENDVVSVIADKQCAWPCGICVDRNDNALVCCGQSNTIMHFAGLDKVGTILSSQDGIKEPRFICFDANNVRLLLTTKKSNSVFLYQLNFSDLSEKVLNDDLPPKCEDPKGNLKLEKKKEEHKKNDNKSPPKTETQIHNPNEAAVLEKEAEANPSSVRKADDGKLVFKIVTGDNNEKLAKVIGKDQETKIKITEGTNPYSATLAVVKEETKETNTLTETGQATKRSYYQKDKPVNDQRAKPATRQSPKTMTSMTTKKLP